MKSTVIKDKHLPGLLSVPEFYERLGRRPGINRLYRHFREGLLRGTKEGRHVYIPASELVDYPERLARLHEQGQR
jgi:hypothetical protein